MEVDPEIEKDPRSDEAIIIESTPPGPSQEINNDTGSDQEIWNIFTFLANKPPNPITIGQYEKMLQSNKRKHSESDYSRLRNQPMGKHQKTT
ncbi:hypothetical protein BB560_004309 [Smittium megazygosporum]|uniref:Uncharacterized protein n=1 Tax=Smittium megazygosporum TaxID=133381 RepID=A0A2T9Z9J9_9FUNG|nr:hypothetical protein BB560_004309 [Smittium megazygosporum]